MDIRRYDREAWRRLDQAELAQEIAQERAGRQTFIQRVGPTAASQLERTAQTIERERARERQQADQRAAHERRMAAIRARIVLDQAAARRRERGDR
jgi:hypothetical protein